MLNDDRDKIRPLVEQLKAEITNILQRHKGGLSYDQLKKHLDESRGSLILSALMKLQSEDVIEIGGNTWKLKTEK